MALKQTISRQLLKEKFGDRNIFNYYFGQDLELGRSYKSVFRKDDRPSTGFYVNEKGSIIYNDLTTGKKYDFVSFVMALFGLTFYEAIQHIAKDFGLIEGATNYQKKPIINPIEHNKPKEKAPIIVQTRPFTQKDLQFWKQFSITKQELIQNNIFSVAAYESNNTEKTYVIKTKPTEIRFAYLFKDDEGSGFFKIYTPYSKDFKWVGNVPLSLVFGLDKLNYNAGTLILTKSVKDCIVLRKFGLEVIGLQNESPQSITEEMLFILKSTYSTIYTWFDSDKPGMKAANYYRKTYDIKPIFILNKNMSIWQNLTIAKKSQIKDPSDLVKQFGIEALAKYLKHINLL